MGAITSVPTLGLDAFDLSISALLPGDAGFRNWLGLPLAMALIASVIRQPVPAANVYVGEIDLSRAIRPLPGGVVESIVEAATAGRLPRPIRMFVPPTTADQLDGLNLELVRCATLDQAILATWPDLH